ncbi:MAG: glycosyltransferase [Akkermansia sp.]|nr:glycosyltransferase [Akkermansia sp.]
MNILFVYNTLLIPSRGGTERVTCSVAEALKKKGHRIFFLTTCAEPEDVLYVHDENYFLIDKNIESELKKGTVIEFCHRENIDIIINEMGDYDNFNIFSKEVIPNVKIITCLHFDVNGYIKGLPKGMSTYPIKRFLLKTLFVLGINPYPLKYYLHYRKKHQKMLKISDAVVVVTPVIAEQLQLLTRVHPEKIFPILNPLSVATQQPTYNVNKKEKLLLYVGRFAKEKNVDKILKAWALITQLHPEWNLELAGTGPLFDECKALAKVLHIPRVHFHGHVSNVAPLYERAEYLILASSQESFACVVLESLALGCHPIVFDYPSAKIVIPSPRIGTRIKQHSTKALANAISKAIQTAQSNKDHMEEVAAHLSKFDMNKLVDEWQHLLEYVTNSENNA